MQVTQTTTTADDFAGDKKQVAALEAFFLRPISGTLLALIGAFVVWQLAAFFLQARRPESDPGLVQPTAQGAE